jgi:hypothetical protein
MAIGGVLGNGSKVGYSATSPVTFVRVAQLRDIPQFISLISNVVDTTVHSSSRLMTSMPGMIPAPEIGLDLLSDINPATTASHETLRTYQESGLTIFWAIEVPSDRTQSAFRRWEFQAYVKEWTLSTKIAEPQSTKVTLVYAGGLWVPAGVGASIIT